MYPEDFKEICFKLHYLHLWSYRKISRFFNDHPGKKSVRRFCKDIEANLLKTMTHDEIRGLQVIPRILIKSH